MQQDYRVKVIHTGTLESSQSNRRHLTLANGTGYWRSDLIAAGAQSGPWAPQAFLVEQDPDQVILPHFHEQNEFQVIVEGDGTFGRNAVRPVTVHYAGRHTGYGPIGAGPRGLSYFSLRAIADPGAHFLPESRDRMEKGPKRHILAEPVDGSSTRTVIEPQPDGIAAWILRGQPQIPAHPTGAARFYVVIEGELRWQGERLPRFGTVFSDSPAFAPSASGDDLQLLCVQFPC